MRRLPLLLIALLLVACGPRQGPAPLPTEAIAIGDAVIAAESRLLDGGTTRLAVGDPAPDFSFTLPDGSEQRLSELRGTPVVLNFWATWCLPCIEEMPALEQALADSEGDLRVLAVNRNELPAAIARFAHQVDVSFPLIANLDGAIPDRYSVVSLPTTYFIDRDGAISAIQIGVLSPDALAERLEAIP
jgi:peroxiredoxin